MPVANLAYQNTTLLKGADVSISSNLKNQALALIDSSVEQGLMTAEDAEFLKAGVKGGEGIFSSSNGFLNDLIDLLKLAAANNSQIALARFEIIDNEHAAKVDAAQHSLDGAKMGFVVSVAGAGASMAVGAYGGNWMTRKDNGEADTSMTGVLINLSSQISQSISSWVTQSYEFKAAGDRADGDQYASLGRSEILNDDLTASIKQAISSIGN